MPDPAIDGKGWVRRLFGESYDLPLTIHHEPSEREAVKASFGDLGQEIDLSLFGDVTIVEIVDALATDACLGLLISHHHHRLRRSFFPISPLSSVQPSRSQMNRT